jgi:hypothetical protein
MLHATSRRCDAHKPLGEHVLGMWLLLLPFPLYEEKRKQSLIATALL